MKDSLFTTKRSSVSKSPVQPTKSVTGFFPMPAHQDSFPALLPYYISLSNPASPSPRYFPPLNSPSKCAGSEVRFMASYYE